MAEQGHLEVVGLILYSKERFIAYFQRLFPSHEITITEKPAGVRIELKYLMTPQLLEKVILMEVDNK